MVAAMTAYADHDEPLERALARLVGEGVLDAELARRIERERDLQAAALARTVDVALSPAAAPAAVATRARLPEVLGYLGGAFVAVAALLVLARFSPQMGHPARIGLTLGGAVALVCGGMVIAQGAPGGWPGLRAGHDTSRRRLVGVLVQLAAPLAALTLSQVLDDAHVGAVLLSSSVVALAVCLLADGVAPGAVPTLGLFVAAATTIGGVGDLFASVATLAAVLGVLAAAAAWTVAAPRLTGAPLLASALGLLALVGDGFSAAQYTVHPGAEVGQLGGTVGYGPPEWGARAVAPVGYMVLFGVVAVGVGLYLRGGPWPWIGGAGLASAAFVGAFTGQTLGPVAAFFAAGLVLLAISAVLLVRRGRQRGSPVAPSS
jgi:hypothetical protein